MIYKNAEIHNVEEMVTNEDGSVSFIRVPMEAYEKLEMPGGQRQAIGSTGVEIRFVIKGDAAKIKMAIDGDSTSTNVFHVYRGGIQGGWEDHEVHKVVSEEAEEFIIKKTSNIDRLKKMSEASNLSFDPSVVRVIFDRGRYKFYDISGDIEPPKKEQLPECTLLTYGSSITHGSNSIDASHSWASVLAHNLDMDLRNLGLAGSCALEKEMADYIAKLGREGKWDKAILELGINVLGWEEEKIRERSNYLIKKVAEANPDKDIYVISPFFYCEEYFSNSKAGEKWRKILKEEVELLNYPNVKYIKGTDILPDMSYISADMVHPNIYGVQKIAEELTGIIKGN